MNVIHGLEAITTPFTRTAVAIGVFDGVHRGHQEILHQTVREARSQGYTPVALTFDIHPSELFAPDSAPPYIASLSQRAELLDAYGGGIEAVVIVQFDRSFAALSPQAFVADVLEGKLDARHVLVGADFCYGQGRAGTVTTLLEAGARNDFAVTVVPPFLLHQERISSTQIRRLVGEGRLTEAIELLGHPFVVQGVVGHGKKLGRTLGYPTANLIPTQPRQLLPGNGVYAVYAHLQNSSVVRAAVSVGTNPTTDTDNARKVEAFLMDGYSGDLYDQSLALDFRAKIRDEQKFDTLPGLVTQMQYDVADVEIVLDRPPNV